MRKRSVVLTFNDDGTVETEAIGFTGRLCEKFTKPLEQAIGALKNRRWKPEVHVPVEPLTGTRIGR